MAALQARTIQADAITAFSSAQDSSPSSSSSTEGSCYQSAVVDGGVEVSWYKRFPDVPRGTVHPNIQSLQYFSEKLLLWLCLSRPWFHSFRTLLLHSTGVLRCSSNPSISGDHENTLAQLFKYNTQGNIHVPYWEFVFILPYILCVADDHIWLEGSPCRYRPQPSDCTEIRFSSS